MDVSGVGLSPAGFPAATPEAAPDPQRSSQPGTVRENPDQARQAPLDLLSDERLGRELLSLGLRPDPAKLLAARAMVLQQGRIDLAMLVEVERSLQAFGDPGVPEAEAAVFLLARRLPANQETMSWVLGRQNAPDTAGARMIAIIQRFAAAMAARTEVPRSPAKGEASAPAMPRPGAEPQAKAAAPSATGAAAPKTAGPAPSTPAPAPAQASAPASAAPSTSPPAPATVASPEAEAGTTGKEAPSPGGKPPQADAPKAPAPGASTPAPSPLATPSSAPAPQAQSGSLPPAPREAVPQALPAAVASELSDPPLPTAVPASHGAKAAEGPPGPDGKAIAKPELPAERELLAKLSALALPEGKAKDVEAALRRLVQALRPQEADLARGEVVEAKERLSTLAAKTVARSPQDASARAVHDEIRFQQVNGARHEGQTPPELIIPVWWKGGSGEIRVQERPKGAARRPEEDSAPMRVVISLETPHLGAIRIDLLLAQRQVNCLVAAQDQGAADFLSSRLTELRSAIEETGIHVPVMGMKPFKTDDGYPDPGDAKGVDFYG